MNIEEQGFVCTVEVLVKLHHLGLRITEVLMILDGRLGRTDAAGNNRRLASERRRWPLRIHSDPSGEPPRLVSPAGGYGL